MSDDESAPRGAQAPGLSAELVDKVFGDAFSVGSDDENNIPTRPGRQGDSEDDDDDDEPREVRKSSGQGKGRLARRARDEEDDDDEDDPNADEDDIRPAKTSKADRRSRGSDGSGPSSSVRRHSARDGVDGDTPLSDRRKRRRTEEDYDGSDEGRADDAPGEDEDEEKEKEEKAMSAMDRALARNKAQRRQRKKDMDPVEIDEEVVAFLGRMMKAREEDVDAYANGKPAMSKLRMLPEVRKMFVRHEFRESLLDHMMLAVLKCWLEPVGDTALPNIEIRTVLLEILSSFRVDSTWAERLENSQGLGKIINYLSVADDHLPNKLMAQKLLKSWTRVFYNSNNDFHDLHEDYERSEGIVESRRDAKRKLDVLNAQNQKRLDLLKKNVNSEATKEQVQVTARVPEKSAFLFTKMAASEVEERVTKNRSAKKQTFGGSRAIAKRFNSLRKGRGTRRTSGRAENPSINGRD